MLTELEILQNLDKLNIKYQGQFNKGWLSILCPFHSDKNLGNAFINSSSVIKCFSCGAKSNLFNVVRLQYPNLSNKQIFDYLGDERLHAFNINLKNRLEAKRLEQEKIQRIFRVDWNLLDKIEVDLSLYYSKTRQFTKEWIDLHNVKIIKSGYYGGYYCIPIKFKDRIITYEFRKAYEYERLRELFRQRGSLEELREKFKSENIDNPYLKRAKTLYPKGNVELKQTIFNYDNLDFDKDLYICEGIAGTAEVFKNISKNVTATYGVNISKDQINLLRQFKKRKIVISDNDDASDSYIWNLSNLIEGIFVGEETGAEYLLRKSGFMDFKIK